MKHSSLFLLLLLALGASLTSCLKDEPNGQVVTYEYGNSLCFNRVTDLQTGDVMIGYNPLYTFQYDTYKKTVDLKMYNISLSPTMSGLNFTLPTTSYEFNTQNAFVESTLTGVEASNTGSLYKFDTVDLATAPGRIIGQTVFPIYNLGYTVNSRYSVRVFPVQTVLIGTTTAVRDGGAPFLPKGDIQPVYAITLNPKENKASLGVASAYLEESMAPFNFVVTDIPVQLNDRGYEFKASGTYKVKTQDGTTDLYSCTVENLSCTTDIVSGTSVLQFRINLTSYGSQQGKYGVYDVTAYLGYFYPAGIQ